MNQTKFFIGIDISAETFISSLFLDSTTKIITSENFSNSIEGFEKFVNFLNDHNVDKNKSIICFESTGVYSEKIAYYLFDKKYKIVEEHPLKVKRAFKVSNNKTDSVDSQQIAEYAYRFQDELIFWEPRKEILEKMAQVLSIRELLVKQKVAFKNSFTSYKRHEIQDESIIKTHENSIKFFENEIKKLDSKLDDLIKKKLLIAQKIDRLTSIPGVGKLLACAVLIQANEFETKTNKEFSAYIGIVPYKNESGTSVFKKAKSRTYGHNFLKKLLCLSSLSMIQNNETIKKYYYRKVAEGKPKRIVLNNIANKTITLCYALLKNGTDYIENYKSINPVLLR